MLFRNVAAGRHDERVDIRVPAEDRQALRLLVHGAGRLGVAAVHGAELDAGERALLVVPVAVALDLHLREPVEQHRLTDEDLEHALLQLVLREQGGLRERHGAEPDADDRPQVGVDEVAHGEREQRREGDAGERQAKRVDAGQTMHVRTSG
jgi:hypothetical protein